MTEPANPNGISGAAPISSDSLSASVRRRYENAYLVAKATTDIGAAVKKGSVIFGVIVFWVIINLGAKYDASGTQFLVGVIAAFFVGASAYVLGVLVSALGEVLKATLDTAVHSSPFITKEAIAQVMSL